ncbi:MAG: amino acid ABC transporter substrate-binding protein [Chloroflexota bacterium]
MRHFVVRPLAALAVLSLVLAACGSAAESTAPTVAPGGASPAPGATSAEPCTITFGAAVSITGKTAKEGGYVKDGYELFKEEINKAGGFKVGAQQCMIDIKYYDDTSDPDTSAQLVEKLVTEDKVNLLLGPYGTNPTFSASAIAEKYEIPMIEGGGAGLKIFDRGYKYIFGTLPAAPNYLRSVLDLVIQTDPSAKNVAILAQNDGFALEVAKGAADYAAEKGLNVVYNEQYPVDTQDVSSLITAVKSQNPDIILGAGHAADSILIMKGIKDQKVNAKAYAFSVGPTSPDFRTTLGTDADYVLGIGPWTEAMKFQGGDVFGTAQNFADMMRAKYGADTYPNVPYQSASAAAALYAYQKAIEAAGSIDPKAVRDALANLDLQSFYGQIKFLDSGIIVKPQGVVQLQPDGNTYTVYPADAANGQFLYPAPAWDAR